MNSGTHNLSLLLGWGRCVSSDWLYVCSGHRTEAVPPLVTHKTSLWLVPQASLLPSMSSGCGWTTRLGSRLLHPPYLQAVCGPDQGWPTHCFSSQDRSRTGSEPSGRQVKVTTFGSPFQACQGCSKGTKTRPQDRAGRGRGGGIISNGASGGGWPERGS